MLVRAFALFMLLVATAPIRSGAQELRAFWADAFNPAIKSRGEIDDLLRRLRSANCNAVFVQVRKSGDAYYESRYEPWAADNPERFDGLRYLIQAAHSVTPRIQVHAWINTCAVGRSHGNPWHVAIRRPDWLSLSDKGEEYDGEATKIDPGHPEAADHTFRIYMDVLRHYDVDGIHFDFVRYGGANWGYNPVSVARFNNAYGRQGNPPPADPQWQQWRRDQVTALVRKVYVMASSMKRPVAVSAATITWGKGPENLDEWKTKSAPMTRVFQDWRAWMEEGILDLNCLMSYYSEAKHADWYRLWINWAKDHQYRRYAIPSSGSWLNTIPEVQKQIAAIRAPSRRGNRARGVLLYCYADTNRSAGGKEERYNEAFYSGLAGTGAAPGPFAKPAQAPILQWKTNQNTGNVQGFVLDSVSLRPIDGAIVALHGAVKRAVRTDGTGYYAFVDVPKGSVTLTFSGRGYSPQRAGLTVKGGTTVDQCVYLGSPVQNVRSMNALARLGKGAPVQLRSVPVVGGTDYFIDRFYVVLPGSACAIRVEPETAMTIPLQEGDLVSISGTVGARMGERCIENAVVRLVGMSIPTNRLSPRSLTGSVSVPDSRVIRSGLVRVEGVVLQGNERSVVLDGPVPIEVVLAGRKPPGVEDDAIPIPAPAALSRVAVTGIATLRTDGPRTVLVLHPRTPEDLIVLAGPSVTRLHRAARMAAGPFRDNHPLSFMERYLWPYNAE